MHEHSSGKAQKPPALKSFFAADGHLRTCWLFVALLLVSGRCRSEQQFASRTGELAPPWSSNRAGCVVTEP